MLDFPLSVRAQPRSPGLSCSREAVLDFPLSAEPQPCTSIDPCVSIVALDFQLAAKAAKEQLSLAEEASGCRAALDFPPVCRNQPGHLVSSVGSEAVLDFDFPHAAVPQLFARPAPGAPVQL